MWKSAVYKNGYHKILPTPSLLPPAAPTCLVIALPPPHCVWICLLLIDKYLNEIKTFLSLYVELLKCICNLSGPLRYTNFYQINWKSSICFSSSVATSNFTSMLTGHGKMKACLQWFPIIENSMWKNYTYKACTKNREVASDEKYTNI